MKGVKHYLSGVEKITEDYDGNVYVTYRTYEKIVTACFKNPRDGYDLEKGDAIIAYVKDDMTIAIDKVLELFLCRTRGDRKIKKHDYLKKKRIFGSTKNVPPQKVDKWILIL